MTRRPTLGIALTCVLLFGLLAVAAGCGRSHEATSAYRCPMHPEVVADRPGDCSVCGMRLVAASPGASGTASRPTEQPAALYVCPMHPEVTSPTPADCPICGMDLEPVKGRSTDGQIAGEGPHGLAPIVVPTAKRQLLGLTAGRVEPHPFMRRIRAAGRVAVDESRLLRVISPVNGWVDALGFSGPGDVVKEGQPLVEIYGPDAFAAVRRDFGVVGRVGDSDPVTQRLLRMGLTEKQIQTLGESSGKLDRRLVVHATASGLVAEKLTFPGQRIESGDLLLTVADLSRVWVEAELTSTDGALVQIGASAHIEAPVPAGHSLQGKVTALLPYMDERTRTRRVRIELANHDRVLYPEMPVTAVLVADLGTRLAVPAGAVLRTGDTSYAFRLADGDHLIPVIIRTGITDAEYVEVLDGLAANDSVVTSATFLIDSESAMAAALQAATER